MGDSRSQSYTEDKIKRDSGMWWRPGRIYLPAQAFSGLAYEATTGNAVKSVGTGTPDATNMAINEINTSGITGVLLKTSGNTINHVMEVPGDMDLSKPLYASVHWTANNTSGSCLWTLTYLPIVANTTVLGTGEAVTAFTKALAAHTMAGVAYTWMRTPEAMLKGAYTLPDTTELIQITVAMTTLVTITLPYFLGLSLRYTPRRMYYGVMSHESKAPTYIAGDKYS